jgi:zinc transporter
VITGIFLPITFPTGLLGINVGGVPFSDDSLWLCRGYVPVMLVIGVGSGGFIDVCSGL